MKYISLALLFILSVSGTATAQLKLPPLSPTCKITQDFSTSGIEISYSRPSMRGRKIFGDLVPYGSVWRTGANSATKFKFGEDVNLAGKDIKAGEYAMYTIPGKDEWEVILNKGVGNWGVSGYDTTDDVARFKVKAKIKDNNTETFTINITNITFNSCKIEMMWENVKVILPVKANNEERLAKSIDNAINKPSLPYYQAASYYYETNQNTELAYDYVGKAVEQNPKAFYMWNLKAKLAQRLGKNDDAIAAAKKTMETAKGTAYEADYISSGKKIIDAVSKK